MKQADPWKRAQGVVWQVIAAVLCLVSAGAGGQGTAEGKAKAATPRVVSRPKQHYAAIRSQASIAMLDDVIPSSINEVFAWMKSKGVKPAGAPFTRYAVIDMARELDIEVCVPTNSPAAATGRVHGGALPAGKYVSLTVTGPPEDLGGANADLQAWAKKRGIRLQQQETSKGTAFRGRAEFYLSDPKETPDRKQWVTEIIYLIDTASGRGAAHR